ncbi:phosphonate C-P lyase system protein PhnG [Pseudonocardia parietis]|uniref:Alpha-D-ribose 1-methylphosphonate 5-triphosphate synthase subunit PhnG n=1 Tax=Pseudonocardia parietis TaxID=570936 RepID=A0ABS4W6K4_9PSEU|nr:phosphonate C-P lyase system protein PhnG [Pseudonocardia parietis]MBP2371800.1 alpha-D-ribose 1-methylphosphonate 5-triphosphate synthase subunit PhnG [Pseudonocardia parietis]
MYRSREDRAGLLALATCEELVGLADACLADAPPPHLVRGPEIGCIATEVVEPVAGDRFLLGDVLACRAEVEFAGARGWAVRLGDDRAAVLAAAICDAAAQAGHDADVAALCERVAAREAAAEAAEWARLAPTIVEFEELT